MASGPGSGNCPGCPPASHPGSHLTPRSQCVCVGPRWEPGVGGALFLSWGWCSGVGDTMDRGVLVPEAAQLSGLGPDKEPSVSGNEAHVASALPSLHGSLLPPTVEPRLTATPSPWAPGAPCQSVLSSASRACLGVCWVDSSQPVRGLGDAYAAFAWLDQAVASGSSLSGVHP